MTLLEKKVDAIARSLLVGDTTDRNYALSELAVLMKQVPKKYENVEDAAQAALLELGVPDKLTGYPQLVSAISIVVKEPAHLNPLQKGLYTKVAEIHGTTAPRAERNMRHAIEAGWDRTEIETLQAYFGSTVSPMKGKPSTGEFIARAANVVRKRMGTA